MEKINKILKERAGGLFLLFFAVLIVGGLSLDSHKAESKNEQNLAIEEQGISEEQVLGESNDDPQETIIIQEEEPKKIEEDKISPEKVEQVNKNVPETNSETVKTEAEVDKYDILGDRLEKYCDKGGSDNKRKCKEYCSEAKAGAKKDKRCGDLHEEYCTIETTITIKGKGGNVIAKYNHFRSSSLEEITVFDLMKKASKEEKFSFNYENYSFGVFIYEINGLGAKVYDGFYWRLSVNGKPSETGASTRKVSDGDKIEWDYTDEY